MDQKTEEFYKRLKEELSNTSLWPTNYLFKFIVPSDIEKINSIDNAFNNLGAVIQTKQSNKGNFTSVSINVRMNNPQHVIDKYLEVSTVEGIISL
jgi:putative lipoic acid-binding regulatory protein